MVEQKKKNNSQWRVVQREEKDQGRKDSIRAKGVKLNSRLRNDKKNKIPRCVRIKKLPETQIMRH